MDITKCDKCKKQQPEGLWRHDKESPWATGSVSGQGVRASFDLCERCGKGLVAYIKKFFGIKENKQK